MGGPNPEFTFLCKGENPNGTVNYGKSACRKEIYFALEVTKLD